MNILIIVAIMVTMLCGIEARVIYRSVLEDEGTSIADQDSRVLGEFTAAACSLAATFIIIPSRLQRRLSTLVSK